MFIASVCLYKFIILCVSMSRSANLNVCENNISQVNPLLRVSVFLMLSYNAPLPPPPLLFFFYLVATGLSTVTDRPTKSACKPCHALHFIVLFVMSVWILLLYSNTAYLMSSSMFIALICLSNCKQECKSECALKIRQLILCRNAMFL